MMHRYDNLIALAAAVDWFYSDMRLLRLHLRREEGSSPLLLLLQTSTPSLPLTQEQDSLRLSPYTSY
jgi:hypothetical protein